MKNFVQVALAVSMLVTATVHAQTQAGRIYTAPDPAAGGGITLTTDSPLTRAIAVERDHTRVFDGSLSADGLQAKFEHLPTGKYDLVLLTRSRTVFEGLDLGTEAPSLSESSLKNLRDRVAAGDTFFNRWRIHQFGVNAETALVFVERLRDRQIFQQSGETLPGNLRRFEILEMRSAADTWQVGDTRHLYREVEPLEPNPSFFKHAHLAQLGSIRVIDQPKNLGKLELR